MWYSQGTITATNNSTVITGVGTGFLQGVRVGDGITIAGSTSLHEVVSVASNTQLTIRPAYAGTTGAGKQYAVAPILGYDKDLSDAFNQLRLQFGEQLSSLQPWAHAATASAALDSLGFSSSGKSVATGTPAQGRAALALGTAATRDVASLAEAIAGTASVLPTAAGVHAAFNQYGLGNGLSTVSSLELNGNGLMAARIDPTDPLNPTSSGVGAIHVSVSAGFGGGIFFETTASPDAHIYFLRSGGQIGPFVVYTAGNTTVDTNGFIKQASPIVKLHSDRIEKNGDFVADFERIDTGHYLIKNTLGLAQEGWYIETPKDANGEIKVFVDYEDNDGDITVKAYEPDYSTGRATAGGPVDIPEGRWIDIRLHELPPEPETDENDN